MSYLEQGYEHIELAGWSRAESHEFISAVLSEESHDDREGLARALHDNPLALTQAVNYIRVMRRNISDYLTRLAREPLMVLDRGQASGHIDSPSGAEISPLHPLKITLLLAAVVDVRVRIA